MNNMIESYLSKMAKSKEEIIIPLELLKRIKVSWNYEGEHYAIPFMEYLILALDTSSEEIEDGNDA